jgi:Tfp pilus assembly protein PilX
MIISAAHSAAGCDSFAARRKRNRGMASVIAMMFLVLIATLSIGFYTTTAMSSQIAANEKKKQWAREAADSGMRFMRYELGAVNLPLGTNSANLMSNLASQLGNALTGSGDMGSNAVTVSNGSIYIPSQNGYVTLDPTLGTRFQATITQLPNSTTLLVTCRGRGPTGSIAAGIQLQFQALRGFSVVGLSSLTTGSQNNGRPVPQIDSWNSLNGPYGTFPMNNNGNVSSNGNISLVSGTNIHGSAQPGIGKTISKAGSTVTGSTAPLTTALSYPTPVPGSAATTNNNSSLPPAYFNAATRDFIVPQNAPALILPGGTYYVNNVDWEAATITFTGPAVFYITGTGTSAHPGYGFWTFNNLVTTFQNRPANLVFEVTNATNVQYDFDQPIDAAVYAPLSTVTTWGAASDYGSIVGNNLILNTGWHVDESLSADGGGPYTPVQGSYIEVP